jgi:hypothetical protein
MLVLFTKLGWVWDDGRATVENGPWKLPCFRRVNSKVVLDVPASPWAKGFEPFLLESLDALERGRE